MGERFNATMDFIDKHQIIRRAIVLWIVVLTSRVMEWTIDFAWQSSRPGLEVAAIIAAIWAPMSVLQGFVLNVYSKGRGES